MKIMTPIKKYVSVRYLKNPEKNIKTFLLNYDSKKLKSSLKEDITLKKMY